MDHYLSLRTRTVRTIGTCQGTCGTRSEPCWLADDIMWHYHDASQVVFTGLCLATRVGKLSHNYHLEGF